MILRSAGLFVRAAGNAARYFVVMLSGSILSGAILAGAMVSAPAEAQSGRSMVHCFDEQHETVKKTLAADCAGRAISAEEAAAVRQKRREYIQKVISKAPHSSVEGRRLVRVGSGFFVAEDGSVLTSHHVVDKCAGVSVSPTFGEMALATGVVPYAEADLALLRTGVDPPGIAAFAEGTGSVVMGTGFLSGYPEQGMVTLSPVLTAVEILRRESHTPRGPAILVRGNVRRGNSGGPLLDTAGSVVGVVLAKIDSVGIYNATGEAVEDIGFILPGDRAQQFLDRQGVEYQRGQRRPLQPEERILEDIRAFMVQVGCWK